MKLFVGLVDDNGIDLFESEGVLLDDYFEMTFIVDLDFDFEEDN